MRRSSCIATCAAALVAGVLPMAMAESTASETAAAPSATFTISSFNVLGSSHTPPGGERAPGTTRIRWTAKLMERHGVDVVGFQELQTDQANGFLRATEGRFGLFPGNSMRPRDSKTSIAWRTRMWQLVETRTIEMPYFDGAMRPMPVVLLRNRSTGVEAWFANFHNPADTKTRGPQARWRERATTLQADLVHELRRTGRPVFVTGDMNEKEIYFCRFTGAAPVHSASGGTNLNGQCRPPDPIRIDWIFGLKELDFYDYMQIRSPLVLKTSDHWLIVSGARIDADKFPRAVAGSAR